jgi:hypothetical protein
MQIKVAKPKLYRNEAGQLVLHVAVKSHHDVALLVVSAYTFKRDELAALPVHQEIHDTKKDPLTKPELVEMVRNMALMYAMSRGEPDIDIVSNHPTVKREPVIQVRKGKSNDIFKTY